MTPKLVALENEATASYSMTNAYRYRTYDLSRRLRFLLLTTCLMLIMLVMMFSVTIFVPPMKGILEKYDQLLSSRIEGMKEIPNIEDKLRSIQRQIDVLTTQSIETRLTKIESAIKAGTVDTSRIASFQTLEHDFTKMKSFMYDSPERMVELRQLQKDYQSLASLQDKVILKEPFEQRMTYIWNIYFVTLGFFGILFTVFLGSWWFTNRRAQPQPTTPIRHPDEIKKIESIGGAI